jgi:hypothetical protein
MEILEVLKDPSVRYFAKHIIARALQLDPVDAIADMELALDTFKEHYAKQLEGLQHTTPKQTMP